MWDKFCLKQLGCFNELKNGYAFKSSDYQKSGIPLIKIGNFKNCRLDYSQCDYLPEYFINDYSKFLLREDDLIIAMSGATTGKIAVVNKKNLPAFLNQRVGNLGFLKRDIICESYLPYVEIQIKKQLMALAPGSAMPNISKGIIERLQIPLPPLDEQRRIVARIEELAAKVEEARGLRRQSAEEAEALFNAGKNDLFNEAFTHQWESMALGDIADIRSGVTLGRKLQGATITLPYLRVANVQDGYLDLKSIKKVEILESEIGKWQLQFGDLLLTEGGDWDKLGRGTVWHGEISNCIHQNHIFRVRLNPQEFAPNYLSALIGSPYGKAYFQAASKQTTNLATINHRQLKAFRVFKPPLSEQHRIVAYLDDLQAKVDALKRLQTETAAELDALLPSILDKAFKGEL